MPDRAKRIEQLSGLGYTDGRASPAISPQLHLRAVLKTPDGRTKSGLQGWRGGLGEGGLGDVSNHCSIPHAGLRSLPRGLSEQALRCRCSVLQAADLHPAAAQPETRNYYGDTNSSMRQLLEAGVHFGHHTRRWNPKMAPYIFGVRNGIHIIDLEQTDRCCTRACRRSGTSSPAAVAFFWSAKRQAQEPVADAAKRCGQYYVNTAGSAAC